MRAVRESWNGHHRGYSPHPGAGWLAALSGSSTLTSTRLEHDFADEVLLFVYPILLRTGKRLSTKGTAARSFKLVSTEELPSGIILSTCEIVGPLKTR